VPHAPRRLTLVSCTDEGPRACAVLLAAAAHAPAPPAQFGKQIQAEQVPGWSEQYLDYKALKKIISAAVGKRPGGDAPELAPEVERVAPGDLFVSGAPEAPADASAPAPDEPESEPQQQPQPEQDAPPIIPAGGSREDRDPAFSKHKALFFFKLERELEKVRRAG
jgi:CDK inhibitor PHO81